ncbi:MAG TPA: hypothetical protein EYG73_00650 [Arcobacter sp.]|nr:hypothetical protein [Arcobacter sp.]
MIDYEGFRAYLERLGFASNGINTYVTSYLHQNKLDILNNFEKYKELTSEEKILKFSEENKAFEKKFNEYHNYSKKFTFSDVQSGARRYKFYMQYRSLMDVIEKYNKNPLLFESNGSYWFFKIFDIENIYPVKAICRESLEVLNLKKEFTTNEAKAKLNDIFNFKNRNNNLVFLNNEENANKKDNVFTEEERDIFIKIAKSKDLRFNNKANTYFQIYPKSVPESEGSGGLHYEFWKKEDENFKLFIHVETKAKNYKKLRVDVFNKTKSTRNVVEREIIDSSFENIKKIFNKVYNEYEEKMNAYYDSEDINKNDKDKDIMYPLNQILYGPPGTGKTYNTIDKALQIIYGYVPDDREEAKERFEELKKVGQIEFVTFHQSYGYEEFVEGIKADVDSDDIRYSIEDGIFQRLSRVAEKNYLNSNSKTHTKKDFDVVFKEKILNKLEVDKLKVNTPQKYFYITDVNDRTIFFEKASGNKGHTLSIRSLKKMYELGKNDFLVGGLSVYYQPLLELLLDDEESIVEPEALKNYILIIDEINRGNISKIFGELITLIEESKRLGNDEAMEVTLPYSGEKFGVPKNLYIIGTMNTADRSIALMDTALRRRFEFEEMMPNSCLLYDDKKTYPLDEDEEKEDITKLSNWHMNSENNDLYFHKNYEHDIQINNINLRRLLYRINQRIEYLYDRDHTIGHAYFMGVNDKVELDSAMRNKVIPLLQEYFYDDWEKIRLVLNDGFVSQVEQKPNDIFDSIDDELVDEEKYSYDIETEFSTEAYRKIYE